MATYVAGRKEEVKDDIRSAKSYLQGESINGSDPQYVELEGTSGWIDGEDVASAVGMRSELLFEELFPDTDVDVRLEDDSPYYRHRKRRNPIS